MVKLPKRKKESEKKHFLRTKEEKERERRDRENLSRKKNEDLYEEKKNRATERKKGDEIESIRDLSRKIEGVRLSALTVSIYARTFSNSFIGNTPLLEA